MRLIIKYQISDGCTYSCDETIPVEYESAEAFAVEFEEACKAARVEGACLKELHFAGHSWDCACFFYSSGNKYTLDTYSPPEILTVDEWFERYGGKK